MIKENPRIAYLIYDSSSRIDDQATLALYGRASVENIQTDDIEGETYFARITEAWTVVSEKVNGTWRLKVQIDPAQIGDVA